MKLQQLRYALEVYKQNLNVSEAALVLFTSQPGISKQIRLLEEELGVQIFVRQGKRITSVTEPGLMVLQVAEQIMREAKNIKKISNEFANQNEGSLSISCTFAQARYMLPSIVRSFKEKYPQVVVSVRPSHSYEIPKLVENGEVDIGIVNQLWDYSETLCYLPATEWEYVILVPKTHHLVEKRMNPLKLEDLTQYPIITYDEAFSSKGSITQVFLAGKIEAPNITLTSNDADLIKTYVRMNMGVGLIESTALIETDDNLVAIPVPHLFPVSEIRVVIRKDQYHRKYLYDFIELFEPSLDRDRVHHLINEVVVDYSI